MRISFSKFPNPGNLISFIGKTGTNLQFVVGILPGDSWDRTTPSHSRWLTCVNNGKLVRHLAVLEKRPTCTPSTIII